MQLSINPLLISLFFLFLPSKKVEVTWHTDYASAKEIAKKEHKKLLVYFTGSDWCTPCIKLKKDLFDTNEFSEAAEDYVLVYIDIPRNKDLLSAEQLSHNQDVLRELNRKKVFPLLQVIKPNGKVVDEHSGYGMNGDVSYFLDFLERNK